MNDNTKSEADRNAVLAEREAKRLAKQAAKQKLQDKSRNLPKSPKTDTSAGSKNAVVADDTASNKKQSSVNVEKPSKKGERRKERKQSEGETKNKDKSMVIKNLATAADVTKKLEKLQIDNSAVETKATPPSGESLEKKLLSKAERRAIQEAQRAAKTAALSTKPNNTKSPVPAHSKTKKTDAKASSNANDSSSHKSPVKKVALHRVKLFNHLYTDKSSSPNNVLNSSTIHPAIVRLGVQYSSGVVKGSNARALAFMNAIKLVIEDYETPSQKEFSRSLEDVIKSCGIYLQQCRPLAVSITNATKFIQWQIRQLPKSESDAELKAILLESIDTYIRDQIDKAAEAISITVQEKISDGDVLLTFGCSSVIQNILNEAKKSKRDFRVIVVDARPWHEGKEMLRRLVAKDIKCTCVLINAVGFIMPEVTKVLLGAHALLANGYVMSRAGTAQIALIAKSYNVPVLVCCETHKFSERVQTDAFVYNEIGNPYDLVATKDSTPSSLANWEAIPNLTPLNLYYDVTPPELVSAVVTEVAILPCTSVPVILRIKPSEIGY